MSITKLLVIALSLLSVNCFSNELKIPYKCHIQLIGGKQLVQHLGSSARNGNAVMLQVQHKGVFAKDGVSKIHINKVVECVLSQDLFSAFASRELDKKTPH